MKRVRLFAMLLSITLFAFAAPVTGAHAALAGSDQGSAKTGMASGQNIAVSEEALAAADGTTKLGWVKKDNNWYYVTAKGNKTGWAKIDGKYYFFNNNGVMASGFIKDQNKWYYLSKSGEMQTYWQKVNGKWYYLDTKTGAMQTGWLKLGQRWFYLDPTNGDLKTGWQKVDGRWYYFDNDGIMYGGPHVYKIDNKYYFFESSGALTNKAGFQTSDLGNTFYTNTDGTRVVSSEIGGKIINSEGVAVNKVDDEMDQKAQWYDSRTKYLVLADLSDHELRVYQGKKGEWTRIKGSWEFSCGATATRTPCGQFELCYKYPTDYGWKRFEKCKAAYVYWTTAGFMLHTILYDKYAEGDPDYAEIADDRLGMNISMSCIRLETSCARWIYQNIPHQTRLVVYE